MDIQTIATSVTNLLTELARVSAAQTALAPPPPPDGAGGTSNYEIQVLRQLQEIRSEIVHLQSHLTAKRPGQTGRSSNNPQSQQTVIKRTNLETLMELECWHWGTFEAATAEEYNQLARRYNSSLRHTHDCLMPLHNRRNKCVFGFPATLGDLVSLGATAKQLLCGALELPDTIGDFDFAARVCGCDSTLIETFPCFGPTAGEIASDRMLTRHQRALDLAAHPPTADSRLHYEDHNRVARKHNAAPSHYGVIKPLIDERGLVVPGFPRDFEWFSRAPKQDVLWLLGEYGLDMGEEGCLERFKEFVGVQEEIEREGEVEWFL